MNRIKKTIAILLFAAMLLNFGGCATSASQIKNEKSGVVVESSEETADLTVTNTSTPVPTATPSPSPTETPSPTPTEEPTPTPTEEPTPTPTETPTPTPTETPTPTPEPVETMVWIPKTGKRYHSRSNCSNMKNPSEVTLSEAEELGYTPCQKCW